MFKIGRKTIRLLILTALTLLIASILTAPEAQAWPGKNVWLTFGRCNYTGVECNRIIGGGLSTTCNGCLSGSYPSFPNCMTAGSTYIGLWGIGFLNGYMFEGRNIRYDAYCGWGAFGQIGFRNRFCMGISGVGVWLAGSTPKGWFPLIGVKCTSPVSLVVGDSVPEPISLYQIQYTVLPEPIPFEALHYDTTFSGFPWRDAVVSCVYPEQCYPGDTIPVAGIPTEIGDSVLVIRGQLVGGSDSGRTYFAAEILDEQAIPTLSEWGLIIFVVLLAGWMTFVVVRRWKASHATAA